jgi:hypothetical protein
MTTEEKERIKKIGDEEEAKSRQVHNPVELTIDFGNLRVTDAKGNTRVILPKAGAVQFEMELEMKKIVWSKIFDDYVDEMTDEEGMQESNLTEDEQAGLASLKKRVAAGEIVICATDKSGRFAIMTIEDYRYSGSKHTKADKEVDIDYIKKNQTVLNSHCSMLIKIFLIGSNWNHEDRMREAMIYHSLSVCPFYLLFKDHKGWEGHMGGPPPTRGIASAGGGQNAPLSEIISMVVEPLVNAAKGGLEKISSADVLSIVDEMNRKTLSKSTGNLAKLGDGRG